MIFENVFQYLLFNLVHVTRVILRYFRWTATKTIGNRNDNLLLQASCFTIGLSESNYLGKMFNNFTILNC